VAVDGASYLRGTDCVTFPQSRLVERLAAAAELRTIATDFELPTFVETMWWHPKAANDAAHEWFRARVLEEFQHPAAGDTLGYGATTLAGTAAIPRRLPRRPRRPPA
jgi:DNA-binding transcriptional LysR family regulator